MVPTKRSFSSRKHGTLYYVSKQLGYIVALRNLIQHDLQTEKCIIIWE